MQVLITDDLSPRGLEVLRQNPNIHITLQPRISPEELLKVIDQYDALIVRSATKVTAEVIQAGKRLKVIGRAGVGVDNVDVEAATAQGVVVMNTPTGNTITTAEHTISLLLALRALLLTEPPDFPVFRDSDKGVEEPTFSANICNWMSKFLVIILGLFFFISLVAESNDFFWCFAGTIFGF